MARAPSRSQRFHDWILLRVVVDWHAATARVDLQSASGLHSIGADGLIDLHAPRLMPWGRSNAINTLEGPTPGPRHDVLTLEIEMQSGDLIRIAARSFDVPAYP